MCGINSLRFRPELIGGLYSMAITAVLVFMALFFAFHFVPKSVEQRFQNAVTYCLHY
ncbi:MAG: hypothetical protein IPN94_23505 [Sphingobacteriales bacterium]|nr:hypothetical protein [Sphingobacteriales bacterium]